MTLTVHKLRTHCRYPKECESAGTVVDEVSRGPLVSELGAQLGPSLDRLPAVVRVRGLRVGVKIPAKRLNARTLAGDWAREFSRALHRALAYPDGDGASAVRRYQSRAAYNAALFQYLLTEGVSPTWEFPEVDEWRGCGAAQAAYEFMVREPGQIAETIAELARGNWLEPLLDSWNELQLEQLIQAIARAKATTGDLTLESLTEVGRAAGAPGGLHPQWPIGSRRQAVRLWARLSRQFSGRLAGRLPLRVVWHGMRLLQGFLERPELLASCDASLLSDAVPFPDWCETIVRAAAARRGAMVMWQEGGSLATIETVLADLRGLVPSAVTPGQAGRWVRSDCCGVLLLLSTVRRMGLWRLAAEPEFVKFGGPRAFSFVIVAAGMKLLDEWDPDGRIDPAVALFAGLFSEVDRAGLKQFFASEAPVIADSICGGTWPEALENLATEMSRAFAQRVRGFRQASRETVVKQFLRVPGRVLVEDQRLLLVLDANPWAVALHISGMDEALEGIEWLGGRRVEFVLEGL
jgi:hypothetical protein